jgi:hypothetical protein
MIALWRQIFLFNKNAIRCGLQAFWKISLGCQVRSGMYSQSLSVSILTDLDLVSDELQKLWILLDHAFERVHIILRGVVTADSCNELKELSATPVVCHFVRVRYSSCPGIEEIYVILLRQY